MANCRSEVRRLLGVLLAVFVPFATLFAQSTPAPVAIRGRVVDAASSAAIANATVDVTNVATGAAAAHVNAAADGTIRVPSLRAGRYRVTVRALGFAPRTLPVVDLTAERPTADVGTIGLTANRGSAPDGSHHRGAPGGTDHP